MQILAFQPLVYNPGDERFRVTNLGALVEGFRLQGINSYQVAFAPRPELAGTTVDGIRLCSPEEACDPEWWKALSPWAVVTNTWCAPRMARYVEAIRAATPRVLDRLDTDGNRSPNISFGDYLFREISAHRDFRSPVKRFLALPLAFARTSILKFRPDLLDIPTVNTMAGCPLVGAESPIAAERMKRLMRLFGKDSAHIHCIPFPVNEGGLQFADLSERTKTVVSVGRWNSDQKNFPLLLQVVDRFLEDHPDWTVTLPGALPDDIAQLLARHAPHHGSKIGLPGPLPHEEIYRLFGTARIFLMSSRHESFGIAAAEALCSGCSVVGPHHIPSIPWFCGSNSGTVACRYTPFDMADALAVEANFWEIGQRDPVFISKTWKERVSATSVAKRVLALLEAI